MSDNLPKARSSIFEIQPYVGGKSKGAGDVEPIKLSSNENPYGASPKAVAALQEMASKAHRYPDGGAVALREAIGEVYDVSTEQLVCGAGSDELIALLIHAYANEGDEVLYPEHGFLMYKLYALGCGAVPVTAAEKNLTTDVDALLAAVTEKTKLVFLANPNNPTGTYIPRGELIRLREGLREDVLLVIDGAYAEYLPAADYPDYSDGSDLVARYDNVVMTRTFSKIYGLGGLRLGWCYAPAHVCDVLNRVRGPFNVTSPAIAAGAAAVRDVEYTRDMVQKNAQQRAYMSEQLTQLGFEVVPSHANFVLAAPRGFGMEANELVDALAEKAIFIRAVAAYGLAEYVRISIGTDEENKVLLAALEELK